MIPFYPQKDVRSFITDNYFGNIPPDRLQVRDSVLFFTCDGPFYEIESSSPAKELKHGQKLEYAQVACHLQGDYNSLRQIAKQLLSVDLNEIKR
jgi:hypothetical protein